ADKPAGEPAATADPILQLKTNLATLISSDGTPYYKGPLDSEQTTMYKNAVRAFQRDAGLVVDGIPGPNTRNAVKAALKAQTSKTGAEGSAFAQGRAPRLGRLLSAGTLLQGSFLTFEEGAQVRLDADLLATETGSPRADVQPAAGKLEQVLHLEKELVLSILAALGLSPSVDERAILMDMPTESFDAFLAYCRGLDMEERGYPAQAAGYYRDAANLDPGFRIASSRADILSVTPEDQESYDAGEMEKIGETKPPTDDRHIHQGEIIGLVPPPEKTQADPQLTPGQKLPTEGTIIVEGDVPN
ncbi:MAG: peptidoglycan-binding protein, partial [Candidatus Eisenbacteria bacterium]|nr:peptidoglycan-binding protein [Candidatus Eisenbacteria bacterium]